MRHPIRMLALSALAVVATVAAVHAQPNFSGTWVLDQAQSKFTPAMGADQSGRPGAGDQAKGAQGERPRPQVTLQVEQTGNTLKATRTFEQHGKQRTMSESYTTDGKESTQTGGRGTVVTRAAFDGDKLVVSSKHQAKDKQGQPVEMNRESVWSLSPDGRTLTVNSTMQTPRGERTMKSVYQKS
jgi:hypothetical protein